MRLKLILVFVLVAALATEIEGVRRKKLRKRPMTRRYTRTTTTKKYRK